MDIYVFVYSVLSIVALTIIIISVRSAYDNFKLKKQLAGDFGKKPDLQYEGDDLLLDSEYHSYKLNHGFDGFVIDEVTWNDLGMDDIFKDINSTQTICGEQILYDILHTPLFTKKEFDKRISLIELFEKNDALRLKVQFLLSKLGRNRDAEICSYFDPKTHGASKFALYLILALVCFASAVFTAIMPMKGLMFFISSLLLNFVVYLIEKRKIENDLVSLNYLLAMISTANKIKKINKTELAEHTSLLDSALLKLGKLTGLGGFTMTCKDLSEVFGVIFLWDLIRYEFSKHRISTCYHEIKEIFEVIGYVDSAISIAGYRRRLKFKCYPQIDFESKKAFVNVQEIVHPMINEPVSNSFSASKSMLITGSNASGKSTFLKTVALGALFSQTVCFCTAQSYTAAALHIYSSMALRDDLAAGESYYIVEIKSIGRIINATNSDIPILCIVDEVLRGTNTVERIAASSEIMKYLAHHGALCIAATHDVELAAILSGEYNSFHFQEYIENNKMTFDYKLHEGNSTSSNAIKLLDIMGYDKTIWQSAKQNAERFLSSGKWG